MSTQFWEFDTRYPFGATRREGADVARQVAAATASQLARVRAVPNRPAAMAYFEGIVAEGRRCEELRKATAP
ncbi:MAG: hypothetical protein FJ279_27520, partial [Planctomycetes bacterium]|nr:hypothetical protein [Planctomycetota bacterium]